jgi:DNA-binding transcriptional LysR family regulator
MRAWYGARWEQNMNSWRYAAADSAYMDLRHVRYFMSVARAGSIGRAAERLRVAQPALSRQLKELEQQFDTSLFDRTRHGARLTPAGAAFERSADNFIDRIERFVSLARLAEQGKAGTIRIGVGQLPLLGSRTGATMATIRRRYPHVAIELSEIPAPHQYRALRAGEIDIAITPTPPPGEPGIEWRKFYDDPVDSAAFASGHPLARSGAVTLDRLRTERLLLIAPAFIPHVMNPIVAELERLGFTTFEPHDSMTSLAAHVAAGGGWTPATHSQRGRPQDGRSVVAVKGLHIPLTITASIRLGESSPLVHNVLQVMHEMRRRRWRAPPLRRKKDDVVSRGGVPVGLEIRHLQAFAALMREQNQARAADELRLSQAGLSRRVREMERLVGATLFQRSGRGMVPTTQAKLLLGPARDALRAFDDITARVRSVRYGVVGICVFGVVPTALSLVLPKVLETLRLECPRLELHVEEVTSPLQPRQLEDGTIDVGIAHSLPGLRDDIAIQGEQIMDDALDCALLSTRHPLAQRSALTAADLRGEPLLIPRPSFHRAFHDRLMQGLRRIGLEPTIGGFHETMRAMWTLAANGAGWVLGAHSQRAAPPPGLVAIPIEGLRVPWGFDLLWRRGEDREEVLAVVRVVRAVAGKERVAGP